MSAINKSLKMSAESTAAATAADPAAKAAAKAAAAAKIAKADARAATARAVAVRAVAAAAASATAPAKGSPAMFLTLGHGDDADDINFNSRTKLPEGYTLITLAQCGVVTTADSVYPIMDAFTNPKMKDILQNPIANRAAISDLIGGMDINIYRPGDSIPDLGLHLFLEWIRKDKAAAGGAGEGAAAGGAGAAASAREKDRHSANLHVQRSGVYKFPVTNFNMPGTNKKEIETHSSWFMQSPVNLLIKEEIKNMYVESLYPTVSEINTILTESGANFKTVKKETYHKLSSVFEKLGPGIYYFVVCRSMRSELNTNFGNLTRQVMSFNRDNEDTHSGYPIENISNENYERFKQIQNRYRKATNKVQHFPAIFPYLLPTTESIRRPLATSENYLKPSKWNSIYLNEPRLVKHKYRTIMHTRRKSMNQQSKYAAAAAAAAESGGGGGGGDGGGGGGVAHVNFKPLNAASTLEEVLSELPSFHMRGINYETVFRAYTTMASNYPQYAQQIINEMYRVVMHSFERVKDIGLLDGRLDLIRGLFAAHPALIAAIEKHNKKRQSGGSRRKTRRRNRSK